jgi:NAD(P) transhydrogenase subunit alpha
MKIGAPREFWLGEARVALTPESVRQLQKLGYECLVETGAGLGAGISDDAYRFAGVSVVADGAALFAASDVMLRVFRTTRR